MTVNVAGFTIPDRGSDGSLKVQVKVPIWIRLLQLLLILGTVYGLCWANSSMTNSAKMELQLKFTVLADHQISSIKQRADEVVQVLSAARGMFAATLLSERTMTTDMWHCFCSSLHNKHGIQGYGYAKVIAEADIDTVVADYRKNNSAFGYYADPLAPMIANPGGRNISLIVHLEPLDWRNRRALGYDMMSEPVRRKAMEHARDLGDTVVSGGVTLVQETELDKQSGFLVYAPLYKDECNGAVLNETWRRQSALSGFVYSPIRGRDFLNATLTRERGRHGEHLIEVSIYDGTNMDHLLATTGSTDSKSSDEDPDALTFTRVEKFQLHHHSWTAVVKSLPAFKFTIQARDWVIIMITFSVSILGISLVAIVEVLANSASRANMTAAEATVALRTVIRNQDWLLSSSPTVIFTSVVGYSPQELIGKDIREWKLFMSEEEATKMYTLLEHTLKNTAMSRMGIESELICKDGRKKWTRFEFSFYRSSSVKEVDVVGSIDDISELKAHETKILVAKAMTEKLNRQLEEKAEEANRATKELNIAYEAKTAFLANMSHEIRTPLNAIIGMSTLLQDTQLTSLQTEYLLTIRTSSENLLSVVNDILDYGKIESGQMGTEFIPVDLSTIIEETFQLVQASVMSKKRCLEVVADIHTNVPRVVVADPTRLRQVVLNLLNNAIKFTFEGDILVTVNRVDSLIDEDEFVGQGNIVRKIESRVPASDIDTCDDGGEKILIKFAVKDTGCGVPTDRIGRLFKPFSQVDVSTTRKYGGTGLGLSICHRIVDIIGGQIGVESEAGVGSTFFFIVPVTVYPSLKNLPNSPMWFQFMSQSPPIYGGEGQPGSPPRYLPDSLSKPRQIFSSKKVLVAVRNKTLRESILKYFSRFSAICISGGDTVQKLPSRDKIRDICLALVDYNWLRGCPTDRSAVGESPPRSPSPLYTELCALIGFAVPILLLSSKHTATSESTDLDSRMAIMQKPCTPSYIATRAADTVRAYNEYIQMSLPSIESEPDGCTEMEVDLRRDRNISKEKKLQIREQILKNLNAKASKEKPSPVAPSRLSNSSEPNSMPFAEEPVSPSTNCGQRLTEVTMRGIEPLEKSINSPSRSSSDLKRTIKVLIVEDNQVNQRVASLLLNKIGYSSDVAANGLEAVDMQRKICYDIVLMDIAMPVMDGLESTRMIRSDVDDVMALPDNLDEIDYSKKEFSSGIGNYTAIDSYAQVLRQRVSPQEYRKFSDVNGNKQFPYIIAVTANASRRDTELCIESGMNAFIAKPVRMGLLSDTVAEGLLVLARLSGGE